MKEIKTVYLSGKTKGIIIGVVTAFALTSAYLLSQRKRGIENKPVPKIFNKDNLVMERYVFSLPGDDGGIEAVVEQGGECYAVHLNRKYTGSMWQDENKGWQWNTHDSELKPYLWELASNLSQAFSRKGFPSILKVAIAKLLRPTGKPAKLLK